MTKQDSSYIRFLVLFAISISISIVLNAQVNIEFKEEPIGQITETSLARINVMNFTGVEIHYYFKGYLTTTDGRELLRLKSELLKHRRGSADFLEEHLDSLGQLNVDPFANLSIQFASEDWSNYTGQVYFRAELIHPLDTLSIIAREDKVRWLKEGQFVDENGNYSTDPKLIKMELKLERSHSFELDSLFHYFEITNDNAHPHVAPLSIIVKQNGHSLYQLDYKLPSIGTGKQDFKLTDFELVLNKYDSRSRQQHMMLLLSCEDGGPAAFIAAPQHAQYSNTPTSYNSRALGLSFQHLEHAVALPFQFAGGPTVIFNKEGEIKEIARAPLRQYAYALPLDYPQGFNVSREDVNGNVSVSVYDWNSLSEVEWGYFFADGCNFSASEIKKEKLGDIEVWLRPHYEPSIHQPERMISFRSLWIAIRDDDRLLLIKHTKFVVDPELPNYVAEAFGFNEVDFFTSLRYNGIGFRAEVNPSGKLLKLTPYRAGEITPQPERIAAFERFRAYTALVNLQREGARFRDLYLRPVPDMEALDQELERALKQPLIEVLKVSRITPELDTIRNYATYEWPEAGLQFVHRTALEPRMESAVSQLFETFSFDRTTDSLLSVDRFSHLPEAVGKAEALVVTIESTSLGVWELPTQFFKIDHFDRQQLTDNQLSKIVANENSNQISKEPVVQQVQLGDWRVFASGRLVNSLRRFGQGNMVLIKTPSRTYRLRITGGFKSDISIFLNSVEIEGKRLRVKYGKEGELMKIWRE